MTLRGIALTIWQEVVYAGKHLEVWRNNQRVAVILPVEDYEDMKRRNGGPRMIRSVERCTMCEEAPATTNWGLPVCQECADMLTRLDGNLKEMEADDPELAELGRRAEAECEKWSRKL